MPDFPNELVEAAAVLLDGMTCERCDGEGYIEIHDPNAAHADNPDGSHDEYCPDCCASGRAGFRKAAALIEQRARLDERERLSSRVHENGWCPTCARDTDEAAMQRLAGKPVESLSRTDLIGLALRNLSAAMDAEARAAEAEQRVIDRLAREADGRAQRLRDAIHAADRELITIADFSVQEAADAIDSVRASLKDALAEN